MSGLRSHSELASLAAIVGAHPFCLLLDDGSVFVSGNFVTSFRDFDFTLCQWSQEYLLRCDRAFTIVDIDEDDRARKGVEFFGAEKWPKFFGIPGNDIALSFFIDKGGFSAGVSVNIPCLGMNFPGWDAQGVFNQVSLAQKLPQDHLAIVGMVRVDFVLRIPRSHAHAVLRTGGIWFSNCLEKRFVCVKKQLCRLRPEFRQHAPHLLTVFRNIPVEIGFDFIGNDTFALLCKPDPGHGKEGKHSEYCESWLHECVSFRSCCKDTAGRAAGALTVLNVMLINVNRGRIITYTAYLCIGTMVTIKKTLNFLRGRMPELLMAISIVLLLVLQFAWLEATWHDKRESFRKEANAIFRSTIFAMHDSLMVRNIETVHSDSTFFSRRYAESEGKSMRRMNVAGDTSRTIEVYVSPGGNDSVRWLMSPLMRRMRSDPGHRRFFIRLGPDSLSIDSISAQYAVALEKSGIDLPFNVHRLQRQGGVLPRVRTFPGGPFTAEPVPFSPGRYYAVSFPETDYFFLKAIVPELLFCLFVTLLTTGVFLLMQRSIRSQKHLVKMKSDFISNITHELKTPVATVSVALEAMERFAALDDRRKTNEYLDIAQDELNRLVLMIDKILQTSTFEDHMSALRMERVNLDDEVRAVLKSMKIVFEKQQIEVHYECKGTDFEMSGSRPHLVTVLYNLIDNAVKYSSPPSTVSVRLEATDQEISLAVEDTGIGIPTEYRKRIFERFFRVPSGDVHDIKGYGLGLSYVAQVVDGHEGKIEVTSEESKGSCFTIRFPKQQLA